MKFNATIAVAISVGSLFCPQAAEPASVSLTPVTGVGRLHGLNRAAQAAGFSLGGDAPDGFIYDKGNLTPIEVRNGTGVHVFGIENNGRVVGQYYEYNPVTKEAIKT